METKIVKPAPAKLKSVYYCALVCLCLWATSLKIIQPINFILVEAFPVTQGGNHLILQKKKKKRPGVSVCLCGGGGGATLMIRDRKTYSSAYNS